jgi:hypothetical protein
MTRFTAFKTLCALALAATGASAQHNTLSANDSASGYQLLFNGTSLAGWRGYNSVNPPSAWSVVAETTWSVIRNSPGSTSPLITADSSFQNFDFKYEYWFPSEANSGVFIRYNFYNKDPWGGNSGPETQIAALNNSDGLNNLHRNGTCYDMFQLRTETINWDRRPGNTSRNDSIYHQFRIVAFNNRVAHYGNGVKLVEYDMTSPAYNTAYTASKYKDYPQYKTIHPGGIYLQHHGESGIRFRNLKIKKLTQSPWAQNSVYLTNPADSNAGLKNSLPWSDNLFPTSIAPANRGATNQVSARLLTDGGNYTLLIDQAGDYMVRVDDLQGRSLFKGTLRNGVQITVPGSAFAGGTRVLRLLSASGNQAFSQLVAPVR